MLRHAGNNERRCIIRESLGLYGSVVIAAKYGFSGTIDKPRLLKILTPAVFTCQKQHPLLNGIIFVDTDTERPGLARATPEELLGGPKITVRIESSRSEADFLSKSASQSFVSQSTTGLPWQVDSLIYPSDGDHTSVLIALVASHGLIDGRSGILFHNTLLKQLRGQDEGALADKDLPLAMEDCGNLYISPGFLIKPVLNEYLPTAVTRLFGLGGQSAAGRTWIGSDPRPLKANGPKTCVHIVSIPGEKVSTLLGVCRARQTRLTSVLNLVLSHALSDALASLGHDFTSFIASTALDLRRALSTPQNDVRQSIGVYPTSIDAFISPTPQGELDWNAARLSTQQLERGSRSLANQSVGLLKYLSNYKQWLIKKSEKPAEVSFGMSNLGAFDPGESTANDVVVEGMFFAQSGDLTGEALNVNVGSVKNGPLSIVFTWWPGMLGVDNEEAFIHDVGQRLVCRCAELSASTRSG